VAEDCRDKTLGPWTLSLRQREQFGKPRNEVDRLSWVSLSRCRDDGKYLTERQAIAWIEEE